MNDNDSGDLLSHWKPQTLEEVRDALNRVRKLADLADYDPKRLPTEAKQLVRPSRDEYGVFVKWDDWFGKNQPNSEVRKELRSLTQLLGRIASGKPAEGKPYGETLRFWVATLETPLLAFVQGPGEPGLSPETRSHVLRQSARIARAAEKAIQGWADYESGLLRVNQTIANCFIEPPIPLRGDSVNAGTGRTHTPKKPAGKGKRPGRPKAKPTPQEKRILGAYNAGNPPREIARTLGLDIAVVRAAIDRTRKRGLTRRTRKK
jgi:DNA-binding CsgD family transcriptional regulator